jgi:hypothetical protein
MCARGAFQTHASIFVLFHPSALKRKRISRLGNNTMVPFHLRRADGRFSPLHQWQMRSETFCVMSAYVRRRVYTKAVDLNLHVVYF